MARTTDQNDAIRERKKEQIRRAALQLFAQKGLFETKIKDIASAVGMAQGLLYHYYASKDEIFVELINEALDKMNAAVGQLEKTELPPEEIIREVIKEMMRVINTSADFSQTCRLIALASNSISIPEAARKLIEEKREIPYREMAKVFARGQQAGTIIAGDAAELAVIFWTTLNGIAIYKATREGDVVVPQAQLLIDFFLEKAPVAVS